jgi:1-deoxyxylulose-5-phosphate synthase
MEYRTLSKSGLKVSRLSYGTMTFGSQTDEANARRMVDRCLDAGISFFDTANAYNQGQAETLLGKALANRRQKVILASKVRGKMGEGPDESGLSRAAILKAIDASLKRLQTDYLDIYYLHMPDYNVPIEETLRAMEEVVRGGKVRHTAVSNYAAWQVCEIHWIAEKNGFKRPTISQPMYNLLARGIEEEYLAFCRQFGIAVVPYNPLAGGLLTGKHSNEQKPIAGTRFDGNKMYLDRYWHDDYFAAVEELRAVAREAGRTLVELAFQWLLSQEQVDSVIIGASRLEQLEENLKAGDGKKLDEPTLAHCDAVWKRLRGITPKYNR